MKIIAIGELPGRVPPKHYDLLGRSLFDADGTKVSYTRMEPAGRCDPHVHESEAQLFIVLKGRMLFEYAGGETLLGEGNAILFEPGELHANRNAADGETEYLTVTVQTSR